MGERRIRFVVAIFVLIYRLHIPQVTMNDLSAWPNIWLFWRDLEWPPSSFPPLTPYDIENYL